MSGSFRGTRLALISYLLLSATPIFAQPRPAWIDPPSRLDDPAALEPPAPVRSTQPPRQTATVRRERAARDLAYAYLDLWSAPNDVTLSSATSFYAPIVTFHGETRTIGSVLAEKRRFAQRWPERTYRHRPETTEVACEAGGPHCTVRSSFDFDAGNPRQGQRSLGMGEHELVVSFSGERPVIISENSRIVIRGQGNMTSLLRAGLDLDGVDFEKPGPSGRSLRQGRTRQPLPAQRVPEPKGPADAVERCGDFLAAQARRLGSEEVIVSSAGPEVRSPDGGVALSINARIEYARQGQKQVRQARVTCRIDPGGRVVALQDGGADPLRAANGRITRAGEERRDR